MKIVLWALYAIAAIICVLVALMSDVTPWFALALALAFIFGPKVWRST